MGRRFARKCLTTDWQIIHLVSSGCLESPVEEDLEVSTSQAGCEVEGMGEWETLCCVSEGSAGLGYDETSANVS